jgi:lysophospholipase L1-like esterase
MVDIARAHHIQVVLGSIPPAATMSWRPQLHPADQIVELNRWLADFARREGLVYVDYHAALAGPDGGMRPELTRDGVHPQASGYALMRPLALAAIDRALSTPAR